MTTGILTLLYKLVQPDPDFAWKLNPVIKVWNRHIAANKIRWKSDQLLKEEIVDWRWWPRAYFLIKQEVFWMPQFCQPEDWWGFTNMSKGRSPPTHRTGSLWFCSNNDNHSQQPALLALGVTQGLPQQAAGERLPDRSRADSASGWPRKTIFSGEKEARCPCPLLSSTRREPGRWWAHHTLTRKWLTV